MQDITDRPAAVNLTPSISPASAAKAVSLVHAIYHSVETNGWASPGGAVSGRLGKEKKIASRGKNQYGAGYGLDRK